MNEDNIRDLLLQADQEAQARSAADRLEPHGSIIDGVVHRAIAVSERRQVRRSRTRWSIVVCLAYVGGVTSATTWKSDRPDTVASAESNAADLDEPIEEDSRRTPTTAQRDTEPAVSVYSVYRKLGDSRHEDGDLEGAIRYYSLALEHASDVDLAVAVTESWLLTSLKRDRRKHDPQTEGETI